MNIVITGATKGIGLAIAHAFAKEGFNLAVCSRSTEDLAAFKEQFLSLYPSIEVLTQRADMSKKDEVLHFAELIKSNWTELAALVNNAGLFVPGEIISEADGVLESQIETNLYSAYYLSRALLPILLPQKSGHIFNICSIASFLSYPNAGSYSISKFAMLGFSKVLRDELKDKGIKVTSVMPGATWSNSWAGVELPESRLMQANDIAIAVWSAFSMSPSAVVEDIILRPQLGDL